jgi:L-lactate dehydrogenase complex protein LldG
MSQDSVISAIRRGLKRGPLPEAEAAALRARLTEHPRHLIPARTNLPRAELVSLLVQYIEREFGTVTRVPNADAVPGALTDYLATQNLPSQAVIAPHPELRAIPWSDRPMLQLREGRAEPTDLVSVQHAFAAIAETGTLMLPSSPERPTTLNLLADTAVVVLRASNVVGAYEEAWDRLRASGPQPWGMPRNVMLVTGPSRSADIEQTLELGAHGPRRLHVLLIEDDPAARVAA